MEFYFELENKFFQTKEIIRMFASLTEIPSSVDFILQ